MPEWIKSLVSWIVSLVCAREKEPSIKTCDHSQVNIIKPGDQKIDVSGGSQVSIVQQNNYQLTPPPQKEVSLTDVEKRLLEAMQGVSFPIPMLARMAKLNEKCTESLLDELQMKGLVLAVELPSIGDPKYYRYHLSEKGKNIIENNKSIHENRTAPHPR